MTPTSDTKFFEKMEAQATASGYEFHGTGERQVTVKYLGDEGGLSGPLRPVFKYTIGRNSKPVTRDEAIAHLQ